MNAMNKLVQLRLVAVLCVAVGLPLLTLKGDLDSPRGSVLTLGDAPTIYLITVAVGVLVFLWLRAGTHAGATIYGVLGAFFGAAPALALFMASWLSGRPARLWMLICLGAVSGALAGLAIWRGDDGFRSGADSVN